MDLKDYRAQIDAIDMELIELFARRMEVSAAIAGYKKERGLPVYDPVREQEKLEELSGRVPNEMKEYVAGLYSRIFELSRRRQEFLLSEETEVG